LGEPYYAETMLPKGYKTIVDWFQEVGLNPEYANPTFQRIEIDEDDDDDDDDNEQKPFEDCVDLTQVDEIKDDDETK
jgi:hypothetical protein